MIATADWEARGADLWTLPEQGHVEIPVSRLAVTYLLLVPLVFFAVHGGFSFEHPSWNSDLGAMGGKMAVVSSASETVRDRVQAWVALAICVAAMAPHYRRTLGLAQRMPVMLLLPSYAISSALWSQDGALSFRSGLSLLLTTLFAFYIAERFSERQQMQLIMAAGVCVGIGSMATVLLWPQYGLDHQLHEGAWQGLFTQKNVCAEATLFLLTPALALSPSGRYGQVLRAAYIVMCLVIIAMSQSRTGWAITLLYLGFAYSLRVLGRLERKGLLPVAAALFATAAGIVVAAVAYPSLALAVIGRSESLSGRAQIWGAISASILRHPIGGFGFDAFWSVLNGEASRVFAAAGWMVTGAHNGFLNVALELGLVGLALVAATLVQALRHANSAFYAGHSEYVDWCIGIVFLTVVYNLDERTLMATQYLPWILYIVACAGLKTAAYVPRSGQDRVWVAEEPV